MTLIDQVLLKINEAEEEEEDDFLQKRGTYVVVAYANDYLEPTGEDKTFIDPEKAIEYWFKLSKKYPTCTLIRGYVADEKKLRAWVVEHEDKFRELYDKYKCPYKLDYLLDACKRPVSRSYDKYPDQMYPFCLG